MYFIELDLQTPSFVPKNMMFFIADIKCNSFRFRLTNLNLDLAAVHPDAAVNGADFSWLVFTEEDFLESFRAVVGGKS